MTVLITGGGGGGGGGGTSTSTSAGGGNMIYFSPRDFSATYTSATTITLASIAYTPQIEEFQYVAVIDTSGALTIYTPATHNFNYVSGTGVLTVTGATFAASDQGYLVVMFGPDKAYNKTDDATKVYDVAPMNEQTAYDILANVTNGADATYYYYTSGKGFKDQLIQLVFDPSGGSITCDIDITAQDDGTAAASCTYVTSGLSQITTSPNTWHLELPNRYSRIKVVVAGGGGGADWKIEAFKRSI